MDISDLKNALSSPEADFESMPLHADAFCAFLISTRLARLNEISQSELAFEGTSRHYSSVAAIGFAISAGYNESALVTLFNDEIEHLRGRTFFAAGRVPRFEVDGIALLGIAVGLTSTQANVEQVSWLLGVLERSAVAVKQDAHQYSLVLASKAIAADASLEAVPNIELRVALSAALGHVVNEEDKQESWQSICSNFEVKADLVRVAISRGVFDFSAQSLATIPINGAGVAELIQLLENTVSSMSHWTFETSPRVARREMRKWHIDHEYHVQNFLWSILKPIFPDLVDEESLPKVGHKSPRFDLGIPSLNTIIEVKFMRKTGQSACAKITEEIAADTALYLNAAGTTGYKRIIAFIWDDCRQTEEYGVLKGGLESLKGLEKAILISRPQRMANPSQPNRRSSPSDV
jgi:hypothetical protein